MSDIDKKRCEQSRLSEAQATREGGNELGFRSFIWIFDSPGPLPLS